MSARKVRRCSLGSCSNELYARGLCRNHHAKMLRNGDPLPDRTRGVCKIEDCWGDVKGLGLCSKHHQRVMKHGDPHYEGHTAPPCKVEGCSERNWSKGYCQSHYAKWRRHGDPLWTPNTRCKMPRCSKKLHGHGLCTTHYFRWRKYGDPFFDGKTYPECKVEGCYAPRRVKGFCDAHYNRFHEYGDPLYQREGYESPMGVDLPMEPIEKILADRGGFARLMDHLGPDYWPETQARDRVEKLLDRARNEREGWIDLIHADNFAVKILGTHPALVWGEDYWTAQGTYQDRKDAEESAQHEEAMAA